MITIIEYKIKLCIEIIPWLQRVWILIQACWQQRVLITKEKWLKGAWLQKS